MVSLFKSPASRGNKFTGLFGIHTLLRIIAPGHLRR
jgi:hypothetical protein